uniref:Uncharacterized protein n=1 Tax=Sinocyclocheilus rhinocerous TaxID=307959 RepID=A0A673G671_9TELE
KLCAFFVLDFALFQTFHWVSCSSWWSNWLIPAVAAVIVTLMYRIYTAEEA